MSVSNAARTIGKICGALSLTAAVGNALIKWVLPLTVETGEAGAVGIIGGADGPTAVCLTTAKGAKRWGILAAFAGLGVLLALIAHGIRKRRRGV